MDDWSTYVVLAIRIYFNVGKHGDLSFAFLRLFFVCFILTRKHNIDTTNNKKMVQGIVLEVNKRDIRNDKW